MTVNEALAAMIAAHPELNAWQAAIDTDHFDNEIFTPYVDEQRKLLTIMEYDGFFNYCVCFAYWGAAPQLTDQRFQNHYALYDLTDGFRATLHDNCPLVIAYPNKTQAILSNLQVAIPTANIITDPDQLAPGEIAVVE